tara:strand:+ start:278 stop:445 length:168 start_codon:yes stop_codon:yes gene_type:complete
MNQLNIDNELKNLAMAYIKAHNEKRYTDAELLLHDLEVMKKLTSDKNGTNSKEFR